MERQLQLLVKMAFFLSLTCFFFGWLIERSMFEHDLHLIFLLLETVVHPNLRSIQVNSEAHNFEANLGWKSKLSYWLQFCCSDIRLQNFFYQGVLSTPGKVRERMLEELIKSPLPAPSTTPPSSSLLWFYYQFVAGGQWTMRGAKVQNIIFFRW